MALLVTGVFLVLLMLLAGRAGAPSVQPLPPEAVDAVEPSVEQETTEVSAAGIGAAEIAPPELLATADELQAQYESRKEDIPDDVSEPIDQDIGVIEGAAADLLAAIASEPNNESLKRMLVATYRNEVKLLKKALHLSSEAEDDEAVE
jgi:hypothetical protein